MPSNFISIFRNYLVSLKPLVQHNVANNQYSAQNLLSLCIQDSLQWYFDSGLVDWNNRPKWWSLIRIFCTTSRLLLYAILIFIYIFKKENILTFVLYFFSKQTWKKCERRFSCNIGPIVKVNINSKSICYKRLRTL